MFVVYSCLCEYLEVNGKLSEETTYSSGQLILSVKPSTTTWIQVNKNTLQCLIWPTNQTEKNTLEKQIVIRITSI